MNLDREMAYTDWRTSCRSPHPELEGVVCRRAPHQGDHASGFGSHRVFWENDEPPRPELSILPIVKRAPCGHDMHWPGDSCLRSPQ